MPPRFILGAACLSLMASGALAHQDPRGDIHPSVSVVDGRFVVNFISSIDDQRAESRMVFTPDGKLWLPRHRISNSSLREGDRRAHDQTAEVELAYDPDSKGARFVLKRFEKEAWTEHPLPIDVEAPSSVEQTTCAGDWVGFTWGTLRRGASESVMLMFSTASKKGFASGKTVQLGEVATIYEFPSASNPVWAAGRWWVAWVRRAESEEERKDPLREWHTMLTSIEPTTGAMKHKQLQGLSSWNTGVSMKTTGGWLCIAWHASKDGSYPGTAKIVTAFEKLQE